MWLHVVPIRPRLNRDIPNALVNCKKVTGFLHIFLLDRYIFLFSVGENVCGYVLCAKLCTERGKALSGLVFAIVWQDKRCFSERDNTVMQSYRRRTCGCGVCSWNWMCNVSVFFGDFNNNKILVFLGCFGHRSQDVHRNIFQWSRCSEWLVATSVLKQRSVSYIAVAIAHNMI